MTLSRRSPFIGLGSLRLLSTASLVLGQTERLPADAGRFPF